MDGRVYVHRLNEEVIKSGCTVGRHQAGGGSEPLWVGAVLAALGDPTAYLADLLQKLYLITLKSFLQLSLLKENNFEYILCNLCLFSRDFPPALTQIPASQHKHLL